MKRKAFKTAIPYTIPVFFGYLFLGMAFGILLVSKGYHFMWAFLMSLIIFAGSMQFVVVQLLMLPFNAVNIIIITLMVNARHLFYGISMLTKFKGAGYKKPYLIFGLTDETFSLLCSAKPLPGVDTHWFYFFVTLLNQSYWILGSMVGAILGTVIPFNSKGIDFAMTALFVVIFIDQWKSTKNHIPALIGVASAVACRLLFQADNFIIATMIVIMSVVTIFRKQIEEREEAC